MKNRGQVMPEKLKGSQRRPIEKPEIKPDPNI